MKNAVSSKLNSMLGKLATKRSEKRALFVVSMIVLTLTLPGFATCGILGIGSAKTVVQDCKIFEPIYLSDATIDALTARQDEDGVGRDMNKIAAHNEIYKRICGVSTNGK